MLKTAKKLMIFQRSCSYKPIKRPSLILPERKTAPKLEIPGEKKNRLFTQLKARILTSGPLTVADYMKEVLTNPLAGYYMNRDVFGSEGDFITSPEIGQIFGELISVWCINEWRKVGSPTPFQLVELGPGRGTLMTDILKVLSHFKLNKDMSIHFVDISPHLSKLQAQRLCYKHNDVEHQVYYRHGETISGTKVYWYKQIEDVPEEFSIILAHEFFDALPFHKLQKDENGLWKEILVDIDPDHPEQLRLVISKAQTPISKIFKQSDDDSRVCLEYNLETEKIVRHIASRFERDGGFGLFMDYGHFGEKSDTFRAFKKHKLHDPLVEPGTADLTADVDFKHIKTVAEEDGKLITFGPIEQGTFLTNMEGPTRLQMLLDHSSAEDKENIESGYKMLTEPSQMGARFKFFSLFPSILKSHLERFPVSGFTK